ncbi:MAG: NERD domain-containing protein [Kiritimatiellae bacterium]|nr:NERD domain-containing protein [Kiritimatiellia bacterium]
MKDEKLRMPFEVTKIRRRPGQSAGERWRTIVDKETDTVVPVLSCMAALLLVVLYQTLGIVLPVWLLVLLFLAAICWLWFRVLKIRRGVKTWRLGENGEQYVGQTLEKDMRPLGYDVFHDVVIKKGGRTFNLDHVLIGPNGVYLVETKAWRKPEKGSPEIEYTDGRLYKMGQAIRDDTVKEVSSLAKAANKLFFELTGRSYYVKPILVVAGWFCKCGSMRDAQFRLLNEKQVANWVQKDTPQRIPDPKDLELLRIKLEQYES